MPRASWPTCYLQVPHHDMDVIGETVMIPHAQRVYAYLAHGGHVIVAELQ